MYVFSQKPLKSFGFIFFQFRENKFGSLETFIKPVFFYFYSYIYISTLLFIYTQMTWHIYLGLFQIWAQLKKFAIASERCDCPRLAEINGLLADFGWTWPQWREGLKTFLCLCSRVMQYCRWHLRLAVAREWSQSFTEIKSLQLVFFFPCVFLPKKQNNTIMH